MQSCINNIFREHGSLYVTSLQKREREQIFIPKCVSLCFTCSNGSEPLNNMPLNPPWQIIQSHLINSLIMNCLEQGPWKRAADVCLIQSKAGTQVFPAGDLLSTGGAVGGPAFWWTVRQKCCSVSNF